MVSFAESSKRASYIQYRIPKCDWYNWKWQLYNCVGTFERLQDWIQLSESGKKILENSQFKYKSSLTPYYLSLINNSVDEAFAKTYLLNEKPSIENTSFTGKKKKFLGGKIPFLQDLTNKTIAIYLPFKTLFQKEESSNKLDNETIAKIAFDEMLSYITMNSSIQTVVFLGDDLFYNDDDFVIQFLSGLKNTRRDVSLIMKSNALVYLPMRFTQSLMKEIKKFLPNQIVTRCSHSHEITADFIYAARSLIENGVKITNNFENNDQGTLHILKNQLDTIGIGSNTYFTRMNY